MRREICLLCCLLAAAPVCAKRRAPDPVPPIACAGREYRVVHFASGQVGKIQNGGVVEVRDLATGAYVGSIVLYAHGAGQGREADARDVFIVSMRLDRKGRSILVEAEDGSSYGIEAGTLSAVRR